MTCAKEERLAQLPGLDGKVTSVRVMLFSDRAQWEDVKHKTIFDVAFTVYDPRATY